MSVPANVITAFLNGETIVCSDQNGKNVTIGGDVGPSAMNLLLMSVAGCSGAVLTALLKRDGLQPESLSMTVEGLRAEERPRQYTDVNVTYTVKCTGLTEEALSKYMQLTERACPVMQSLNVKVHLSYKLL